MSAKPKAEDYERMFYKHLTDRQYQPETVETLSRYCRLGKVSAQTAVEIMEVLEEDSRLADSRLNEQAELLEATYHYDTLFGES